MTSAELEELARESLAEIDSDMGYHPGYRAAQARGTLCRARFISSGEAARLTRAPHLQPGADVPVTVRFSNFHGDPMWPDGNWDVRGMSAAFHLPAGRRTDLTALMLPRFFAGTARQFVWWQRSTRRLGRFGLAFRPRISFIYNWACGRLPFWIPRWQIQALKRAPSYAHCYYNSLHAFKLENEDGEHRYARCYWEPEAGVKTAHWWQTRARHPDYLRAELARRLAAGPVRFSLELQLAEAGDRVDDATRKWPGNRSRVDAGTLEVRALGTCAEIGPPPYWFDPTRVIDGIGLPERDDLLMLRRRVYELSRERRTSAPEEFPRCPA